MKTIQFITICVVSCFAFHSAIADGPPGICNGNLHGNSGDEGPFSNWVFRADGTTDGQWTMNTSNGTVVSNDASGTYTYSPGGQAVTEGPTWVFATKPTGSPEFGSNSDIITNSWLGLKNVGDSYSLVGYGDFAGATRTFSLIGKESVLDVNCLILQIYGHGNNPVTEYYDARIAQGIEEDIWALKITGIDGDGNDVNWEANSVNSALMFLPSTPQVGHRWEWEDEYTEIIAVNQTVPKMSTSAGPYYGCILERWGNNDGDTDDSWTCRHIGTVKEIWDDEGRSNGWERIPDQMQGVDLRGEYWFGSLSADANSWIPWGKMGTVIINDNYWDQEWDANDGHHTFSDSFTTSVQLDGSLDIEFSSGTYNVAWNGNMMVHADASPDANNHLGVEIIARKATNVDVNDWIGRYTFFGHWLDSDVREASVGWGTLDVYADGNAVATWAEQDGNDYNATVTWTLDDVNGIIHIPGLPDAFVCEGGIIMSFRATPDAQGDFGYNFFVKKSNEVITPDDIAGTYTVRFLETSVFGQSFTCGKGTAVVNTDGTLSVDAYYSDGEHDVGEMTYVLGPGNMINFPDDPYEEEGIISPDKSLIFIVEYKVPPEPTEDDWIGGIFCVRTVCNIADLDEDRDVDFADYAAFSNQWFEPDPNLPANFNHDSRVDWLDLKIFAENWLWYGMWLND